MFTMYLEKNVRVHVNEKCSSSLERESQSWTSQDAFHKIMLAHDSLRPRQKSLRRIAVSPVVL